MSETEMEEIQNGLEQLPEAFTRLKFDGLDVLPFDRDAPDAEKIIWLYRAACLRIAKAQTAGGGESERN